MVICMYILFLFGLKRHFSNEILLYRNFGVKKFEPMKLWLIFYFTLSATAVVSVNKSFTLFLRVLSFCRCSKFGLSLFSDFSVLFSTAVDCVIIGVRWNITIKLHFHSCYSTCRWNFVRCSLDLNGIANWRPRKHCKFVVLSFLVPPSDVMIGLLSNFI